VRATSYEEKKATQHKDLLSTKLPVKKCVNGRAINFAQEGSSDVLFSTYSFHTDTGF